MELENILKLIDAVSASALTRFSLDDGEIKLDFSADRNESSPVAVRADITKAEAAGNASVNSRPESAKEASQPEPEPVISGNTVKSPLVGIFYGAASPAEPDFVKVGDTVKKGQVLGIVEAMKLMNEIESDYDGVVRQILVENEQLVEFGQPMFVIE